MKNACLLISVIALLGLNACNPNTDDTQATDCDIAFDQQAMYSHYVEQLILPSFQKLNTAIKQLAVHTDNFQQNTTARNLELLQESYKASYLAWQAAAPYHFGPASEVWLRSSLNNFPVNIDAVQSNITSGNYDLDKYDTYDKGFPAMDYLLFMPKSEVSTVIERFTNTLDGQAQLVYLVDIVADMEMRVSKTYQQWSEKSYQETFVANTGTQAGSSLSLLINALNEHYEIIKRERIGIPSGVLTLGFANPDKVEAFYSDYSKELLIASLKASEVFYLGLDNDNKNGLGLDDYLIASKAQKGDLLLDEVIQTQFKQAIQDIEALPRSLSTAISEDPANIEDAYYTISNQVVHIKTDMPAVLCVAITYVDNPSDSD